MLAYTRSGPSPTPSGRACAVATRALAGFSPDWVRPNQKEICSRGPRKGNNSRGGEETRNRLGSPCQPSWTPQVSLLGRVSAEPHQSHFSVACPRPVPFAQPGRAQVSGKDLGSSGKDGGGAPLVVFWFCSSLPSQIPKVCTLAWPLALSGSQMHRTLDLQVCSTGRVAPRSARLLEREIVLPQTA